MKKQLLMSVAVVTIFATVFGLVSAPQVSADKKIDICHRTNSATNPYVKNNLPVSAIDGTAGNSGQEPDHYGEHKGDLASSEQYASQLKKEQKDWGDIIPPVPGVHSGLNWSTLGQAMWNNNCNYVTTVTPAEVTFIDPTCDINASFTITATEGVVYKISGVAVAAGTHQAITGQTVTITAFAKDSNYLLSGKTTWTHEFVRDQNCEVIRTTPVDVIFVNPTCKESGSYTIPTSEGVVYKINDVVVPAGTYTVANGDQVTVIAEATEGYELSVEIAGWSHTFVVDDDCASDDNGVVLGDKTIKNLPVTSGDPTVANVAIASTVAGLLTALSLGIRSALTRKF